MFVALLWQDLGIKASVQKKKEGKPCMEVLQKLRTP